MQGTTTYGNLQKAVLPYYWKHLFFLPKAAGTSCNIKFTSSRESNSAVTKKMKSLVTALVLPVTSTNTKLVLLN
jgi:hypothetical protein